MFRAKLSAITGGPDFGRGLFLWYSAPFHPVGSLILQWLGPEWDRSPVRFLALNPSLSIACTESRSGWRLA